MNDTNESSKTILHSSENEETALYDRTVAIDHDRLKSAEENITADWNVGDVILDLYEVADILGQGGMGKVYKVHHKNWKIDLAVKSPLPDIVTTENGKENFIREAETWVNLGLHPHIVSCYYVRTLGNIPRVFAEYVEGGSLKDWINNRKLYEGGKEKALERIIDIAIQFAWGLDYAHEQGLIHQDIKPANILMTSDGIAKVTDFGLAKARAMAGEKFIPDSGRSVLVSAGGMTPVYCSPEQAAGEQLSRKTDIWSWGLSILEMFIGERWWDFGVAAEENLNIYIEQGSEDPDIPKMPDSLLGILRKCFKKEPQERPANMTEIVNILKEIYKEETKKEYPKKDPRSLDLRADRMNNRAISYLDLGKEDEARKYWEEALKADPQHLETTFNYGYFQWQKAEILYDVFIIRMEYIKNVHKNNPDYWLCLGWIYYERGDVDTVDKIQKSEYRIKDEKFIKALNDPNRPIGKEIKRFEGHADHIHSVCYSPDGRYALSGSDDRTIRLWEISSGKEIKRFEGHTGWVVSVCYSPDGRYALSGGKDETISLWEISTGKNIRRFEGHTWSVHSICFSPDGHYVLSGSGDNTIRLWDISSGREIRRFNGHTEDVKSVCFSPDGLYALSGSIDSIIRLWDISVGKEIRKFEGHTNWVVSVCFSPNGHHVLSGSWDNTIRLWEISTGKEIRKFEGHTTRNVHSVCFSPDGRFALSGSDDRTVRLWEISTGKEIRKFEGHTSDVKSVCFSPDGRYALSGSDDKTIRLWEISFNNLSKYRYNYFPVLTKIRNIKELENINKILNIIKNNIDNNDFDKAYKLIIEVQNQVGYEREKTVLDLKNACCTKGKFRRIVLNNGWCANSIKGNTYKISSVSFSPDGHYTLIGCSDKTIRLLEVLSGKEIRIFEGHTGNVESVCFSHDGLYILSGSSSVFDSPDNSIRLWEISSGREIRKFEGHNNCVKSVCFSPDGRYALSGSCDNTIRLWEISSGKELRKFVGHINDVNSVCFSQNGRYALSGSGDYLKTDNTIRLWEISNGKEIRKFEGHTDYVLSVCFSPDNRYILSGSGHWSIKMENDIYDFSIRLWEISSGKEIRRFEGHTREVNSICFSPDGYYALSGSSDQTIRLWEISSGKEIKRFEGHTNSIKSVSFSPCGRYAFSGSYDNNIRLWEFDWDWEFPEVKN